jgi:quercetin dioxygenase-like cupin family protein
VVSGTVLCGVGDQESLASAGTLVHVPANTTHWYKFGEDGGEMVSMTSAGNASSMYADLSQSDSDRSKFGAIAGKHGQEYR